MKKSVRNLYIIAVICFVLSGIMLYQGYDKMNNYYNPESVLLDSVNAYVGGDAYNYIINGTYATAYYTLASGFLISGLLCVISGIIVSTIDSKEMIAKIEEQSTEEKMAETWDEELPPL